MLLSVQYCFFMLTLLSSSSLSKVAFPHIAGLPPPRCSSSCTKGGKGFIERRQLNLCTPEKQASCPGRKAVEVDALVSKRCEAYAKMFTFFKSEGNGKQVKHAPNKGSWLSCAVFCQTTSGSWYTPKSELAAFYMKNHLPDGVVCHEEEGDNYYCQGGFCLPEDMSTLATDTRSVLLDNTSDYSESDRLILDDEGHIEGTEEITYTEEGAEEQGFIEQRKRRASEQGFIVV